MSVFGLLYGPQDVEDAIVATYRSWFTEYIAAIERQHGFQKGTLPRPPAEESTHGGSDFESWRMDDLPELIVVVKPNGEPKRLGNGANGQEYEVGVAIQWRGVGSEHWENPEDEARAVSSYLGTAAMLLVQKAELTEQALPLEVIQMGSSPDVTFPVEGDKTLAQVELTFRVWVTSIVNEMGGPVGATPQNPKAMSHPKRNTPPRRSPRRPA